MLAKVIEPGREKVRIDDRHLVAGIADIDRRIKGKHPGRFVAFQSDCDLLGPNPDQTVFVYDLRKSKLLDFLILRGPGDTASALPQVVESAKAIVFAGNVGSANPAVCIFNAKKKQLEGPLITPP